MTGPYVVKFEHLDLGEHGFVFEADQSLFEGSNIEEVLKANIKIDLKLYKTGNMMDFEFNYQGNATVPCDRCNDPVNVSIQGESRLAVKYGQEHHDDFDEMMVLDDREHEIDLTQYFYESLSLLIPVRHVHDEKNCNQDILKKLGSFETENESGEVDPRWEKLKEI